MAPPGNDPGPWALFRAGCTTRRFATLAAAQKWLERYPSRGCRLAVAEHETTAEKWRWSIGIGWRQVQTARPGHLIEDSAA